MRTMSRRDVTIMTRARKLATMMSSLLRRSFMVAESTFDLVGRACQVDWPREI